MGFIRLFQLVSAFLREWLDAWKKIPLCWCYCYNNLGEYAYWRKFSTISQSGVFIQYIQRCIYMHIECKCLPDDELVYSGPLTSRPQNPERTNKRRFVRRKDFHCFGIVPEGGQPFAWKRRSKFAASVNLRLRSCELLCNW